MCSLGVLMMCRRMVSDLEDTRGRVKTTEHVQHSCPEGLWVVHWMRHVGKQEPYPCKTLLCQEGLLVERTVCKQGHQGVQACTREGALLHVSFQLAQQDCARITLLCCFPGPSGHKAHNLHNDAELATQKLRIPCKRRHIS